MERRRLAITREIREKTMLIAVLPVEALALLRIGFEPRYAGPSGIDEGLIGRPIDDGGADVGNLDVNRLLEKLAQAPHGSPSPWLPSPTRLYPCGRELVLLCAWFVSLQSMVGDCLGRAGTQARYRSHARRSREPAIPFDLCPAREG